MTMSSPAGFLSSQSRAEAEPLSQISDILKPGRKQKSYRPAQPLPYELRQHCVVFLAEELYSQAFALLLNLLTAGIDNSHGKAKHPLPAYIPHSQVIALAVTLVVHPSMTNRALSPDHVQAADDALFYLDHLNAIVDPASPEITTALQFASADLSRLGRRRGRAHQEDSPDSEDELGKLHTSLATSASIWNKAEDFWSVVGWAFNCAIRHQKRWDRWKLWLTFMLNVLEDNLETSMAAAKVKAAQEDHNARDAIMADTLLAKYLTSAGEGRTGKRRVMRAVLANGSKKALAEFPEIWKNETKERKPPKETESSKRKRLDVEEGEFGDYMDVDGDEDEEDEQCEAESLGLSTSSMRRSGRRQTGSSTPRDQEDVAAPSNNTPDNLGNISSIALRQRFMALLVKMCNNYEDAFMDIGDLFALYTEFLRPLPLPVFTQFVLPSVPYLEPHAQTSLSHELLRVLVSSDAPTYNGGSMTQADFELHYLPYAANYTNQTDNVKVSILIEGLLRLLVRYLGLQVTKELKSKLEEGITARDEKARSATRKKPDDEAVGALSMSAARMRMMLIAVAH